MKTTKTKTPLDQFLSRLADTYPLSLVQEATLREYAESLNKAKLSTDQWEKVLELIKQTEDRLPSIAKIWERVKEVRQFEKGIVRNQAVILFDLDGYQTSKYFIFPNTPKIPERATNVRIRLLDTVPGESDTIPSLSERREAFLKGWIESGADPALADKWFAELDRAQQKQIADYDDREEIQKAGNTSPALDTYDDL
jgi:hypothetical protein